MGRHASLGGPSMFRRFQRSRLPRAWTRRGALFIMAGFAGLLVHVFLVRLPEYLLSARPATPGVTPLTAPDWAVPVEILRAEEARGAGGGPLGGGIPAAPESH